jgi:hypothetical protein
VVTAGRKPDMASTRATKLSTGAQKVMMMKRAMQIGWEISEEECP